MQDAKTILERELEIKRSNRRVLEQTIASAKAGIERINNEIQNIDASLKAINAPVQPVDNSKVEQLQKELQEYKEANAQLIAEVNKPVESPDCTLTITEEPVKKTRKKKAKK